MISTSSTKDETENLAMSWIDYKRAYDMVPQSWIINYPQMISGKVINFIDKAIKTWIVELTAGGISLVEMKIQRGIVHICNRDDIT